MNARPLPEFSRPLLVADFDEDKTVRRIEADTGERSALAERFGIVALDSLSATVSLHTQPGRGVVRVHGEFSAEVVQTCVVTLEPLSTRLHAAFERLYGPEEEGSEASTSAPDGPEHAVIGPDAEEPPQPFVDGAIDIGEAVAEQLAIELDPFPRAPGAVFQGFSSESDDDREAGGERRPFATLKDLMGKTE
ncbi:MAG: DUF177 domain-containing protein [Rhodospirillales bacterium]|nr:DUF177 domain-containing protein [Rhodospirillales bacterium]MDP6788762.1 DUF177 domain-containing protein [Rhodospirillales bacterium]